MLKTLRITSLIIVVLAVVGVAAIATLGLKGDPEIVAFLEREGIVDSLRAQAGQAGEKEEKSSPLVALAQLIALRFDPPPPPKPPTPTGSKKPDPKVARSDPKPPVIPQPKPQISAKYNLLATVVYKTAPEKSLALLSTTGNKQEWFRLGERAGNLEIQEILDGSVMLGQSGQNPQQIYVPAKTEGKSLLKGGSAQSVGARGKSSVTAQIDSGSEAPEIVTTKETPAEAAKKTRRTPDGKIRMTRPATRPSASERIDRVRSASKPPAAQEEHSPEKTMSRIEEIMSRPTEGISAEERKKEDEMWKRLVKMLNEEKEQLEAAKDDAEQNKQEADEPAPADPNRP